MKVLFIGGTGTISSACSDLLIKNGFELYLLNRGQSFRPIPVSAIQIKADINDQNQVSELIKKHYFDVVVDWIAYTPKDVQRDFQLFHSKTSQYIFISSASVYAKPPQIPITESHPVENPYWDYAHNKILCEQYLKDLLTEKGFPSTIVRPSHTYDEVKLPLYGGFTVLNRMLNGKKIIIHGDGNTHWTLTSNKDFALGLVGIIGKTETIGEIYHITSDEILTWNQICHEIGKAAKIEPDIVHIPSEIIARYDKDWGDGLFGDKAYNLIFDNSKIKKLNPQFKARIPYREGAKEQVEFLLKSKAHQVINQKLDLMMDKIIGDYLQAFKNNS